MSTPQTAVHTTFTVERTYPVPPARVFAAFADPATKRRWFADRDGAEALSHTLDFRVGGREETRSHLMGQELRNDTVYHDIVSDRRIVFSYTMTFGEKRIAVSLATVELAPAGDGTTLTFTDQNVLLDGSDAFLAEGKPGALEDGWKAILERLAPALAAAR
jgi:uncharacterized protein YndB with AHSA1/START domain